MGDYESLLSSLETVSAFDIEDKDAVIEVLCHPDPLGSLLSPNSLVHDFKLCLEKEVEEGTYGTNDRNEGGE